MRKLNEIDAEIKALEGCKAFAPKYTMFNDDNHAKIDLQIDYLRGDIDVTSGEFEEYSCDEQSAIMEAKDWEEGLSNESPSSGWETFKPKAKASAKRKR